MPRARRHATLVAARAAIEALFSDKSVSAKVTEEALKELRDDLDTMLDALRDDRRHGGGR